MELFPSANAVYEHLDQQNLRRGDVLWVRMCSEDPDFDYENLAAFTYHNCFTKEGSELVDKYVKGQEFPVGVIEGLSGDFDVWDAHGDSLDSRIGEEEMWRLRRMLYICCSRANVFLYFVTNSPETSPEIGRLKTEISTVVKTFSQPTDPLRSIGATWEFTIHWREGSRPFKDIANPGTPAADDERETESLQTLEVQSPIVVKFFAPDLGIKPFILIKELMELGMFANINQTIDFDMASIIARAHGFALSVSEGGS